MLLTAVISNKLRVEEACLCNTAASSVERDAKAIRGSSPWARGRFSLGRQADRQAVDRPAGRLTDGQIERKGSKRKVLTSGVEDECAPPVLRQSLLGLYSVS